MSLRPPPPTFVPTGPSGPTSPIEVTPAALRAALPAGRSCERLFFDVDDTLTVDGKLPLEAITALYAARDAGLVLCAVTGRSYAWGELLCRLFPFDAVVAETGAQAFFYDDGGHLRVIHHEEDRATREGLRAHRISVCRQALETIPTARYALDNDGRVADTAFDLVEEGPVMPADDVAALRTFLHEHGIETAQSSVHVNAFVFGPTGPFSKATMVDRLLRHRFDSSLDEASSTLCYVGDSMNDGTLFARAALSVGVENVRPHLPALAALGQAPRLVVAGRGGHGFAALVRALVAGGCTPRNA